MENLKEWMPELALDTIVAAVFALIFYAAGWDKTWNDASLTFLQVFIVMFVLGVYGKWKRNKSRNK